MYDPIEGERLVQSEDRLTLAPIDKPTVSLLEWDDTLGWGEPESIGLIEISDHLGGVYIRLRKDDLPGDTPLVVLNLGGAAMEFLVERLKERLDRIEREDD
jgi:hypothetical protein